MINEFYLKNTIGKEATHENDLELYAIKRKQENSIMMNSRQANILPILLREEMKYHQEDIVKL